MMGLNHRRFVNVKLPYQLGQYRTLNDVLPQKFQWLLTIEMLHTAAIFLPGRILYHTLRPRATLLLARRSDHSYYRIALTFNCSNHRIIRYPSVLARWLNWTPAPPVRFSTPAFSCSTYFYGSSLESVEMDFSQFRTSDLSPTLRQMLPVSSR